MWDTPGRLLRLLVLLQGRRQWTADDLARRLEVTDRTVRRDVDRLRSMGYPVESDRGRTGGYRLVAGSAMPPLLLDDDEAIALAIGLRSAVGSGVRDLDESAVRALLKVQQVLPDRLRRRATGLAEVIESVSAPTAQVDPDVLVAVTDAAREQCRLRFDYRPPSGPGARREVEAYRVVQADRHWYLVAFDIDRDGWRTFRLDRMTPRVPLGQRFRSRELPPELLASIGSAVTTAGYRIEVEVTVHAGAAVVSEHFGPRIATIAVVDDDTCRLSTGGHSLDEIAAYLTMLPAPFTVESPPELIDRLAVIRDHLADAHRRSTAGGGRPVGHGVGRP